MKQLLELAEDCTKTPINQFITNADWGTINFEGSRAELERTFDMLNQFKLLPARLLPDNIIQQIISTLQPLKATLDQIRGFSIEQGTLPKGATHWPRSFAAKLMHSSVWRFIATQ